MSILRQERLKVIKKHGLIANNLDKLFNISIEDSTNSAFIDLQNLHLNNMIQFEYLTI